ncbi:beta-glucosidase BglX [Hyphococcus luteus]|uniref:Beta-D-glucoside glucohydrolase n=1 Tax=Hyphococcus luteus TaxID=2058213 RepID=A0A2S7KAP7_9PROT|nr:beta-glucosidase BglX [Marinicaulis flavus]PQA89586.1 beta-glucosidase BglX [Marinicaulis flavus]
MQPNRIAGVLGAILLSFSISARAQAPDLDALMAKMSVEEKIGQLNQVAGGRSKNLNSRIDDAELDRVRQGHVGSYLHVAGAAFLKELQRVAVEESPHGVPLLFAMDVVHGYRTIFPVPIAMASTWDPAAAEDMARVSAAEASAAGLHWTFAPMVDIARDPRWGRIVEGSGADPYLGSVMAAAQVRGYQGGDLSEKNTIMATAKHLGAYGAAEGGRDYDSADISVRTLNEVYLPPFFAAARAGTASFMTAFNDIAGVPTTANGALINGVVRDKWGWNGVILSDWNAIAELMNHGVAADRAAAARLALSAGVDMDMTSGVYSDDLKDAVSHDPALAGKLDAAVRRILKAKADLGLFDDPYKYHDPKREKTVILSDAHREAARRAAEKAVILLKNEDDLLPLTETPKTIAVIGALADDALSQLGSWRAQGKAADVVTLLEGLRRRYPDAQITFEPGAENGAATKKTLRRAARVARSADVVILAIGENYDLSGEARSRSDIALPPADAALFNAIAETGKPFITIIMSGRPLALGYVAERAPALLQSWYLGVEAGNALAAVLSGNVSPAGRLPVDMPRVTGQAPYVYSHRNTGRPADPDITKDTARYHDLPITPQFPFGYGLSYATFDYGEAQISAADVQPGETVTISISVTNTGPVAGDEVVQLYLRDPAASIARPVKELRGFKRLRLEAEESAEVEFDLAAASLAFFDADEKWRVEKGRIDVMIGASSADIRATTRFRIMNDGVAASPGAAVETPAKVIKIEN